MYPSAPNGPAGPPEPLTAAEVAGLGSGFRTFAKFPAPVLVPIGGTVLMLLRIFAVPSVPCTPASPCLPDPAAMVVFGMMTAILAVGVLHAWFAAAAAFALAAAFARHDLLHPDHAAPLWFQLVVVAGAGGCVLLARAADPRRLPALRQWSAGRPDRQPPLAPTEPVRPPLRWALAATALLAGAAAGTAWITVTQDRADARRAAADRVPATVQAH